MKTRYAYLVTLFLVLAGCTTVKQATMLQDVNNQATTVARPEFVIGVGDQIQVAVSSHLSQEAATAFNQNYLYTVQSDSCIIMPVLGSVKVAGETEQQVREQLVQLLEDKLPQCQVYIKIANASATILGEVKSEGQMALDGPITIFEAIGRAKGFTNNAKRDKVQVVRVVNQAVKIYEVNLLSEDVFTSPCYYILNGDIIYVRPLYSRTSLH